jgi:hypothetical protein
MVDKIGVVMNGLEDKMKTPAEEAADATLKAFEKVENGVEDSLVGIIRGTTSMKDAFKSTLNSMINDALRAQVIRPLINAIFGSFGGGGGFDAGAYANEIGVASFAGGGFTGSGSRSGGVDGKGGFPAILHPNETVTDHKSNKARLDTKTGEVRNIKAEIIFNVQAIDASSFNSYLVNNRQTIEGIINSSLSNNGSVRRTIKQVV